MLIAIILIFTHSAAFVAGVFVMRKNSASINGKIDAANNLASSGDDHRG